MDGVGRTVCDRRNDADYEGLIRASGELTRGFLLLGEGTDRMQGTGRVLGSGQGASVVAVYRLPVSNSLHKSVLAIKQLQHSTGCVWGKININFALAGILESILVHN